MIVAVIAAATGGWLIGKATESSASASVELVPARSPGRDPFTVSVAVHRTVDFPDDVRAVNATVRKGLTPDGSTQMLVAVGTTPGLYGGSNDIRVCDPAKLVSFLEQNPSKAAAWARVFGITPSSIGAYVAALTPVVLTSDTYVTNHGYKNGVANPIQSVLQAGTAVLVDRTGTPRVKCNCGNPLTPADPVALANAHTTGTRWPGYSPATVTAVQPGPSTDNLTLVDINTGDTFRRPTGTSGGRRGLGRPR